MASFNPQRPRSRRHGKSLLGVFAVAAATRRPVEGRKSAGVLTPVTVVPRVGGRTSPSAVHLPADGKCTWHHRATRLGMTAQTVNQFRRYPTSERPRQSRPGAGLVLEFASVAGSLLGQLSHFGYGIFVPDDAA